jgi:three-Cys-motif partner protein
MFVDPYSTQLNWDSLVAIAKTQKIDAWFLFPIGPVSRLLPNDKNKLIDAYRKPLNRLFGSNEWEEVLYRQKEPPLIDDMFAQVEPKELGHERVTQESVEIYTKERLQTLFPLVEGPHALYSSKSKLFNLYFCCANPNPKAWGLAKRLSANVFKRAKLKEL